MGPFDPGGATASRIAMPHILPSTVPSVSASATFFLSWLNPPPHPITVYASHPPSPATAQHSLPGGALPPYRGRSFTGRKASASPDAPELKFRIQSPPADSLSLSGFGLRPKERRGFSAISAPVRDAGVGQRRAKSSNIAPWRGSVSVDDIPVRSAMRLTTVGHDPKRGRGAPGLRDVGRLLVPIGSSEAEQGPLILPGQWQT
jgi:hypothetical protein